MSLENKNIGSAVLSGAAWAVAMRWSSRFLGLISTVILVRLLNPSDFGLVAMAMLVVGFIDIWTNFGVDLALIQNKGATHEDYDTAWTIRIIQGGVVALCIGLSAPLAADYFHEPRLPEILWVIAAAVFVQSLSNIGVVNFRKHLDFSKDFATNIIPRVIQFVTTISIAFIMRSYWALVIGIVTGFVGTTITSYIMSGYRPRLSLSKVRQIWSFSQWSLVANIGYYAQIRADEVLVGRLTSTHSLGIYNVSSEIAQLPSTELMAPLNRALFPAMSHIQDDQRRFQAALLKSIASVNFLTIPAGMGLALVSPLLVPLLLGDKWSSAIPILAGLAIFGVMRISVETMFPALTALGKIKSVALLRWVQFAAFLPAVWVFGVDESLMGVVYAKIFSAAVGIVMTYKVIQRSVNINLVDLIRVLWRPVVSATVMCITLLSIGELPMMPVLSLILQVVLGIFSYGGILLLLWHWSGRPTGPEEMALDILKTSMSKLKA